MWDKRAVRDLVSCSSGGSGSMLRERGCTHLGGLSLGDLLDDLLRCALARLPLADSRACRVLEALDIFAEGRVCAHGGKDSESGLGPGLVPQEGCSVPADAGFLHGAAMFDYRRQGFRNGGGWK